MNSDTPVVSVVLPVYNARQLLPRCLASLSAQTFRDFEVIAVDDGSTDGSGDFLETCGFGDRLRVIHQQNAGASAARNAALRAASGTYVFMMDADDVAHPRLLECAVAAANGRKSDFVLFDFDECAAEADPTDGWTGGVSAGFAVQLPSPPLQWFVEECRQPALWQFLWRRVSLAGMSFLEGVMYEDNAYIYSYLSRPVRGVHLKAKLYRYFSVPTSVMHVTRFERRLLSMDAVLRRLKVDVPGEDYDYLLRNVYVFWVKSVWRDIGRGPQEAKAAFCRFLRHAVSEGIIVWNVFPLRWRLRLGIALLMYRSGLT